MNKREQKQRKWREAENALVGMPGMTLGLKLFLTACVLLLGLSLCLLFSYLPEWLTVLGG